MTAGILQLVAKSVQDFYITDNPQITYFKIVYRRHTNFSLEAIPQYFKHQPDFGKKVSCLVSKNGDLIEKIYLVIKLPKIKGLPQTNGVNKFPAKFAWVKKIGYALIKTIEIEIGGQLIDRHWGEWLNILNELTTPNDKKMDIMIGNIPQLTNLTFNKEEYNLYIPLQFWFCKTAGLALPLLCFHFSDVKINLELSEFEKCYISSPSHYIEVQDDIVNFQEGELIEQYYGNIYRAGIFSNFDPIEKKLYYLKLTRENFISLKTKDYLNIYNLNSQDANMNNSYINPNYLFNNNLNNILIKSQKTNYSCIPKLNSTPKTFTNNKFEQVSIQSCYLLVNYIYLDSDERNRFIQNKHEYLIEQIQNFDEQTITSSNFVANINCINPCKYLTWITQMNFFKENNDTFNYTDGYLYGDDGRPSGSSLIKNCALLFNGHERISNRSYKYFNYIQPMQVFKNDIDEGICLYSFAINPREFQPSGSCNMSYVNNCQIKGSLSPLISQTVTANFRGYAVTNNILRVIDGLGGLVFVS